MKISWAGLIFAMICGFEVWYYNYKRKKDIKEIKEKLDDLLDKKKP